MRNLLFYIAVLTLLYLPAPAVTQTRLRIGVIAPLTGTMVSSGEAVRNSVLLADALFDRAEQVEFIIEDDGLIPKNSLSIARKFIAEKFDAIMIFGTPTALAVAPVTEQAAMPLLAISILDKVSAGRRYTLRHFVSWQEETRLTLKEAAARGYKKIAVVTTINDASLALRDGFLAGTTAQIVLNQEFVRDDMDFRAVSARIKALKPDAIYHLLFSPQGSAFMRALRSTGCSAPVFGAHNVEDPHEAAAAQGAYEGIWYVSGDDRAGQSYFKQYQKRFGSYPAMGGANAFDYAKMIIEAAQSGAPILKQLLELRDFEGAFGRYSAAAGNSFNLGASVREIRGGQFVDIGSE